MRILLVTAFVPNRSGTTGGAIVLHGQATLLARKHQVTLLTVTGTDPGEPRAIAELEACGIHVRSVPRQQTSGLRAFPRRSRLALRWLRSGDPLRALAFRLPAMQDLVDRTFAEAEFDLVQVEDSAMAAYSYPARLPAVLTEHEVRMSSTDRESYLPAGLWPTPSLAREERRRWSRFQRGVWRRFDRIQVFTERDAAAIRTLAPELSDRIRVNPFGIDLPEIAPAPSEEPATLLFLGAFLHPPNVDAALCLAEEILPLVRSRRPGVKLMLVGSHPPAAVRQLAADDILVTGRVPTVEPFLRQASVFVAPLRQGGGMKVKVLQAMAFGKAVVTTALGVEGLASESREPPVIVARDPAGFAECIALLLADEEMRRALGLRAREFVSHHHSWSAYGRRLEAIYSQLPSGT